MPFDALTQVEDIGGVGQLFPTFSQIGLDYEGARGHVAANFMPHQFAIDETHGTLRKASDGEMVIKVRGIKSPHAQGAAAPGLSRLGPPQRSGAMQGPGGQGGARGQASLQYITTAQTRYRASSWIWCLHG